MLYEVITRHQELQPDAELDSSHDGFGGKGKKPAGAGNNADKENDPAHEEARRGHFSRRHPLRYSHRRDRLHRLHRDRKPEEDTGHNVPQSCKEEDGGGRQTGSYNFV